MQESYLFFLFLSKLIVCVDSFFLSVQSKKQYLFEVNWNRKMCENTESSYKLYVSTSLFSLLSFKLHYLNSLQTWGANMSKTQASRTIFVKSWNSTFLLYIFLSHHAHGENSGVNSAANIKHQIWCRNDQLMTPFNS